MKKRLAETSFRDLESKRRKANNMTRRDLKAAFENMRSSDDDSDESTDGVMSAIDAGMKRVSNRLGGQMADTNKALANLANTVATVLSSQQKRAAGGGQLSEAALKELALGQAAPPRLVYD